MTNVPNIRGTFSELLYVSNLEIQKLLNYLLPMGFEHSTLVIQEKLVRFGLDTLPCGVDAQTSAEFSD